MIQLIAVSKITVPEFRQRQFFDEDRLAELVDSIQRLGLLQPIVLRSDGKTLLAGQRRLRAVLILYTAGVAIRHGGEVVPPGTIPFVTTDQLDPIQLHRAELEENLCREDLTWQEEAQAVQAIHKMELALDPGHTMRETASIITKKPAYTISGQPLADVSDALLVTEHLGDPEVAKAGSLKEAKKIVSRKLEREFREALAAQLGQAAFKSAHQLLRGNCIEVLKTLPAGKFDCVVTDPPYGVDADQFGTQATTGHKYKDSWERFILTQTALAPELFRVMKEHSHLYMFCDPGAFSSLERIYTLAGFNVWRTPLIWNKFPAGMLPSPEYGPRRTYETIMYAMKGKKLVTAVYCDILSYPPVVDKDHGAQKPIDVYIDLLKRTCIPGDECLDCFCGSGTIFPAASKLNLKATGIELDAVSFTVAAGQLNLETPVDGPLHSSEAK